MAQRRPGRQVGAEYERDLNPNALAGENYGLDADNVEAPPLLLSDIKEAHERLPRFSADELRRIPVLRPGSRLEQGCTYVDLAGDRRPFTATGDMTARPGSWLVRKQKIEYTLWNRLLGIEDTARTGADPSSGRLT